MSFGLWKHSWPSIHGGIVLTVSPDPHTIRKGIQQSHARWGFIRIRWTGQMFKEKEKERKLREGWILFQRGWKPVSACSCFCLVQVSRELSVDATWTTARTTSAWTGALVWMGWTPTTAAALPSGQVRPVSHLHRDGGPGPLPLAAGKGQMPAHPLKEKLSASKPPQQGTNFPMSCTSPMYILCKWINVFQKHKTWLCCYSCGHLLIHLGVFLRWDNDQNVDYGNATENQGKSERQGKKERREVYVWEAYGFATVIFLLDLFLSRVLWLSNLLLFLKLVSSYSESEGGKGMNFKKVLCTI